MPLEVIASLFGGTPDSVRINGRAAREYTTQHAPMYELLRSMYWSDIYEDLNQSMSQVANAQVHPIRNPTYRIIEFYARHLWPGRLPDALPIETENPRLPEAVHLLWQWSNWTQRKQVMAREYPLLGDSFIKVAMRDDGLRVFLQIINPAHVIDFEVDERENITMIHLQTPLYHDRNGVTMYDVEFWSKEEEVMRTWRTTNPSPDLTVLGAADEEVPLQSMGIDFVPFVHAKFRDVGQKRGTGVITLSFRKILEADLIATALHQRLFRYNKPDTVLVGTGRDDVGRPPPEIDDELNAGGAHVIGGERVISLPNGWDLRHWIANLDYSAMLRILQDHMSEIENDNPELAYYNLRDLNQVSGRAVRMLLTDSIATIMEARGNGEDAMIRAQQMGITIMQAHGLIRDVGSYDQGDLDHQFEHRDIFPLNDAERAEERRMRALADSTLVSNLGWSVEKIQDEWGLDAETIQTMKEQREGNAFEATDALIDALNRGTL